MKGDTQLKRDVVEELDWDPAVNAAGIGVEVQDGIVTLTGHLPTLGEKYAAEAAVKRIPGVLGLAVELDVRLPSDFERTDADIARAVRNVLDWGNLVPNGRVQVMVEGGSVNLTGSVDWNFQRMAAEHVVAGLYGVRHVTNGLVVRPQAQSGDLRERITEAIVRQAGDDARHVDVKVRDGDVTLSGSVRSWAEHEAAFNAAWSAPGVTTVTNAIRVTL